MRKLERGVSMGRKFLWVEVWSGSEAEEVTGGMRSMRISLVGLKVRASSTSRPL